MATASPVPGPVGYLVNHPAGLAGVQGIGYDYVLGSGGLYVQSESAHLTARVTVAPGTVRGLAPVAEKLQLTHGPIPASLFELGLRWFQDAPDTERFFAVRWDGGAYRLVVPPQAGTATRLAYQPPAGVVAEFHSHGGSRAFFSATDDRDEQGFRIYGVVGRLDTPLPELRLRVGGLRPLRPGGLAAGFRRPGPGRPAHGRRAGVNTRHKPNDKEVTNALLPGQRVPAGQSLDHRGRLRRDRRLRGRGPLPPLPGAGGHHRPGRPRPGGAPQPAAPELLHRGRGPLQEPGPRRPAGQGLPASRRILGLPLPGGGLPPQRTPLPRPSLPRELPAHRLRRQRRSTAGDGGVPARRPAPVAHRRGQRHQLGTGAHRERGPIGTSGTNKPSSTRPATCCPRPRSSGPTC